MGKPPKFSRITSISASAIRPQARRIGRSLSCWLLSWPAICLFASEQGFLSMRYAFMCVAVALLMVAGVVRAQQPLQPLQPLQPAGAKPAFTDNKQKYSYAIGVNI